MLSSRLSRKHKRTLAAAFSVPTRSNIRFDDIERLIVALGGEIIEGRGSRIAFSFAGRKIFLHRPHPGNVAMKYQVEGIREFLLSVGVENE